LWIKFDNKKFKVIPKTRRAHLIKGIHELGHFGVNKTAALLRCRFWWPHLRDSVREFIHSCDPCQRRKPPNPSEVKKPSGVPFAASYPLEIVSWDIMGPIPVSKKGNRYIVVIEDVFSKWVEAFALPETSAATLAEMLWNGFFSKYGPPQRLHSDKGKNLNAIIIKELCKLWGVRQSNTVAYHPQGNGLVERMNRTLQAVIATKQNEEPDQDWDDLIPIATYAYNVTPQSTTKIPPYSLFFGREARLPVMEEWIKGPNVKNCGKYQRLRQIFQDITEKEQNISDHEVFKPGEKVLLWRPNVPNGTPKKFHSPWKGPFTVIQRKGFVDYYVRNDENKRVTVHASQLKHWNERTAKEDNLQERRSPRYGFRPMIFKPSRLI
jgi:hypothetical protein